MASVLRYWLLRWSSVNFKNILDALISELDTHNEMRCPERCTVYMLVFVMLWYAISCSHSSVLFILHNIFTDSYKL